MSVDQNDVVDFVSQSQDGECVLTIADHLAWDVADSHLLVLQEKLNRYLAFIESGELIEKLPKYEGVSFRIHICFKYPPDSTGERFLELARGAVEGAGFRFGYSVFPEEISN